MKKIRIFMVAMLLEGYALAFVGTAGADLVTSEQDIPVPFNIIDFSEFDGNFQFTSGPVQIGDPVSRNIEWSSTNSSAVIGNGVYSLVDNGFWDSGRVGYTGLNTSSGSMTFKFNDSPVAAVGGFINYAPGFGDVIIEALDNTGAVLESYVISDVAPVSTPGATNAGEFRGIVRSQADIAALRLNNGIVVLDDFAFAVSVLSGRDAVREAGITTFRLTLEAALEALCNAPPPRNNPAFFQRLCER